MKVIIDRFEGDYAVVELPDMRLVNMPRLLLPDAAEGDVVEIRVDQEATAARKERIARLIADLEKE